MENISKKMTKLQVCIVQYCVKQFFFQWLLQKTGEIAEVGREAEAY